MTVQLQEPPRTLTTEKTFAKASAAKAANPDLNILLSLWEKRHLISLMVMRDVTGRYRESVMGVSWAVLTPLGNLLLYTFVFSIMLNVKFSADASTGTFALYLVAGLLPWSAFSESIIRATTSILAYPNFVKRVVFPLEILPLVMVGSALSTQFFGMAILIAGIGIAGGGLHSSIIYLPAVILAQVLFTGGLSWLVASIGVFMPDFRHMMALAMSLWMFSTPVVFPSTAFPPEIRQFLWLNPMAGIVTDYRRILLEAKPPDWTTFAIYAGMSVVFWFAGYYFFIKTKRSFADVV